jgi:sugar phosphate isomerase/epimerase
MKLSFTTLGCPAWDLDTIISQALKMGFDGVDFRGYHKVLEIYTLPEFNEQAKTTAQRFADAGLEVPCFSSSARAFNPDEQKRRVSLEEVRQYARLCAIFGARYIRVFGGAIGDTPPTIAIDRAARDLEAMFEIASDHGARILVETHDNWVDSDLMHRLIGDLDGDMAGVLWDISNPIRQHSEPPELTWINLGRYIEYTHWKDSRLDPLSKDGYTYTHFGEGDLPLETILKLLKNGNYQGYLALEWEKLWHPELAEPEIAFPKFVQTMRRLMG